MKEFKDKNDAELVKYIEEKREELRTLRFGTTGSAIRNTHAIRNTRRDIARALTELTHRTTTA